MTEHRPFSFEPSRLLEVDDLKNQLAVLTATVTQYLQSAKQFSEAHDSANAEIALRQAKDHMLRRARLCDKLNQLDPTGWEP